MAQTAREANPEFYGFNRVQQASGSDTYELRAGGVKIATLDPDVPSISFPSGVTVATLPRPTVTRVDVDSQNATLPASTLASGFLVHTSVTGAGTLTVDSGANLDTAFPEWQVGEVRSCFYLNDGNQTVTLTGATGATALSAQTIATLQGRMIRFLKTAAQTYSVWAD